MDFHHSAERSMLAETLGRFLQKRYPVEVRHQISESAAGWSSAHWGELAELGVLGGLVPEAAGGFGGSGFDIAAIFEQLGRAMAVEPFLGTLMAVRTLAKVGGHNGLIGEVLSGASILAFAHEDRTSRYDLTNIAAHARRDGDTWLLNGGKALVTHLEAADDIIVSARISGVRSEQTGIGLFLVKRAAAGVAVEGYPLIDGGRAGELQLADTPSMLLTDDAYPVLEDVVAAGIVALSWEAVGIMDMIKTTTLDYLRTRQQFGVPIGKFQALQHRMATVALEIEQARSAAINAANGLQGDRAKRERSTSAAKYTIGRAGTLVAEEAIQLHGGMGMTWELPVSHFAKRLMMIGHQLGDEDHHLARFIAFEQAA
jgi:alkylation response protein AidB-like acyl-CoA dehydrogenase